MNARWKHICEECEFTAQTAICDIYKCTDDTVIFRHGEGENKAVHVPSGEFEAAIKAIQPAYFSVQEIAAMEKDPEVLRQLADWHETQLTMADAMGDFPESVAFHSKRKEELLAKASAIEADY